MSSQGIRIPTAPVPFDWLNPEPGAARPMFPMGPPSDFGGAIIPNPDNIQALPDTQAPGARLDGGTLSTQNFRGKLPIKTVSDSSVPPLPAGYQLDSPSAVPPLPKGYALDRPAAASAAAPDSRSLLDHLANDSNNIPLDGFWDTQAHVAANIGQGTAQAVQGTAQLLDPRAKDDHEKAVAAANPIALPVYRIFRSLGNTIEDAKKLATEYHRDGGPTLQELGDVSGVSAGNLIPGVVASPEGLGAAGDIASDAKGIAARGVRAGVRGANRVLAKAPGSVGASVGGAVGAATHLPGAAELGAGIGYAAGKELLPQLKIPGEGFGLPNRVQGGPATVALDELRQSTGDVVDQAVPGKNKLVKSRVNFYLKKGDIAGAEAELDKGAKAANPAWTPLERQPVPSTNDIRARVQAEAKAPKAGSAADAADDRAIQQEMNWNLQRHGWAAESEARREFIARNSTGATKGGLTKAFAAGAFDFDKQATTQAVTEAREGKLPQGTSVVQRAQQLKEQLKAGAASSASGSAGKTAPAPAAASGTGVDDLVDILQQSLDAVLKRKAQP